jgi:large subunit ribosomal protein L6
MKKEFAEKIQIPSGVNCKIENNILKCIKGSKELSRSLNVLGMNAKVEGNEIVLSSKGNKKAYKTIKSYVAHINNLFHGLEHDFVYKLEICNVHFPMTAKVEGSKMVISNFLGEKTPRIANLVPGVEVKVQGNIILVSSPYRELAGQTAANIEKVTIITKRDRRVFQDGIFITEKPARSTRETIEAKAREASDFAKESKSTKMSEVAREKK